MAGKPIKPGSWGDWATIKNPPKDSHSCSACMNYHQDGSCRKLPIVIKDVGFNFWKHCEFYQPKKPHAGCKTLPKNAVQPSIPCKTSIYSTKTKRHYCKNHYSPLYSQECIKCSEYLPRSFSAIPQPAVSTQASVPAPRPEDNRPHLMTDIHSHIVFGVDDGSANLQMSLDMLRKAYKEGIRNIVCTSHSWADLRDYDANFKTLQNAARAEQIDVRLYQGCEAACSTWNLNRMIAAINSGTIRTINHTPYVLIEFDPNAPAEDILLCARRLKLDTAKKYIVAHIERCRGIEGNMDAITKLQELGFLFQLNVYSLVEETREETRSWARTLLRLEKVSFLGSDCHRSNHRPPKVKKGLDYIYQNCSDEYIKAICRQNPHNLLMLK